MLTATSNENVVNMNKRCRPATQNGDASLGILCPAAFHHPGLPMQMATLEVEGISAAVTAIGMLPPKSGVSEYLVGVDDGGHGDGYLIWARFPWAMARFKRSSPVPPREMERR